LLPVPRLLDRVVELAAIDEDCGGPIEEHQRHHGGGEARIHRHVRACEAREEAAEPDAGDDPQHESHCDAGRDLDQADAARPRPGGGGPAAAHWRPGPGAVTRREGGIAARKGVRLPRKGATHQKECASRSTTPVAPAIMKVSAISAAAPTST